MNVRSANILKLVVAAALGLAGTAALVSPASAIVGGTTATQPYSFMVSVEEPDSPRTDHHACGGALLAPQWVLTASHCAQTPNQAPVGTPRGFKVRVGSISASSGGQVADVDKFYRLATQESPGGMWGSDMAMLHLKTPVAGKPLPLATSVPTTGTAVRIMGWGMTCDDTGNPACFPDKLSQADTVVQPDSACSDVSMVTGKEVCVGATNGSVAATNMDSGGPLLVQQNGQWALAGTVDAGDPGFPTVYEDTPIHNDWINGIVSGKSLPPSTPEPSLAGEVSVNGVCMGSVVRMPDSRPQDPALLLTNGHCVQNTKPAPGKALVDQPVNFQVGIEDHDGYPEAMANATRLVYATMTGTDVALYRLDKTYGHLAAEHGKMFTLSTKPMSANEKVTVLSYVHPQACTVQAVVPQLREGGYQLTNAVRSINNDTCGLYPGMSGSAMVTGDTVVGVHNTSNQGTGQPCANDNPCEVAPNGTVTAVKNAAYGEQINMIPGCFTAGSVLDLNKSGCTLTK